MKLTEMKPTELIELAIKDGCVTAEDYGHWLNGYMKGVKVMAEDLLTKDSFSDDVRIVSEEVAPLGSNPYMEG